jgi:hypothetical protein
MLPVSTSGVPGWRRAGGVEAGLTLVAARREGAERRRRRGGGQCRGREGSSEQRGGPAARGGGEGGGCGTASERRGNHRGQGTKFGRRRWLRFKGKQRGGCPEGWAPHGGGAGEREGERGGLAWHGAAQRRGVGAAAARPRRTRVARCRATVESGGVGAMRGDVSDRWAGAPRCSVHQQLGAAWGNAVRRSARRGHVGSVAQCARFGFQTESKLFQTDSNLP